MQDYKVLIDEKTVKDRIAEVGAQIRKDFEGKPILAVCVLRGAVVFYADLIRHLPKTTGLDFIAAKSYGSGTTSTGEVALTKDLSEPVRGRHVIIIEDIVDTGVTLTYLKKLLLAREPASVSVCTLLDKPSRRKVELVPEYSCFTVPNEFIVGYGLDYAEEYRTLKDVCILEPWVYQKD